MMKKQIIIVLLLFQCSFLWSQKFVKTTTPCNDDLLKKTPGLWIHAGDYLNAKISKQQQQEIFNRLDKIHQFVVAIYPSPVSVDAVWTRNIFDKNFACQLKISHLADNRIYTEEVNGIPWVYCQYNNGFFGYFCGRQPNEIIRGWPAENGEAATVVSVDVNRLEDCFTRNITDNSLPEMLVDGRPIKIMPILLGKWKGFDVFAPEQGSGEKLVLLHRPGMLPYIPVTRKQYLDLISISVSKLYNKMIADAEKTAKAWGIKPDPADNEKFEKQKKDELKHYQDEMAATTSAGLLDAPAIIRVPIGNSTSPIFISEASGGTMLATENPAYLRKDLPKYIPQFMVLSWRPYSRAMDPYKAIDENFPIEKLQAMIDK